MNEASPALVDPAIMSILNAGWFGILVGGVLFFAGGVLSVVLYYKAKQVSELRYALADAVVVGAPDAGVSDDLAITFAGVVVPQVTSTSVAIWNAGRTTIRGEDIVASDALRLVAAPGFAILRTAIEGTSRSVVGASVTAPSLSVREIGFDFLDAGDAIRLRAIHTGTPASLELRGTIRGIPAGLTKHRNQGLNVIMRVLLASMGMLSLASVLNIIVDWWPKASWRQLSGMLLFLAAMAAVSAVSSWLGNRPRPRRLRGVPQIVTQDDALFQRLSRRFE